MPPRSNYRSTVRVLRARGLARQLPVWWLDLVAPSVCPRTRLRSRRPPGRIFRPGSGKGVTKYGPGLTSYMRPARQLLSAQERLVALLFRGEKWDSEAICIHECPGRRPSCEKGLVATARECAQIARRVLDLQDEELARMIRAYRESDGIRPARGTPRRDSKTMAITARRLARGD